jgi:hypothetical protein
MPYSATGKALVMRNGHYYTRKGTRVKRTYPTPAGRPKKAGHGHKKHHGRKHKK